MADENRTKKKSIVGMGIVWCGYNGILYKGLLE
jgi:hypothetical protein